MDESDLLKERQKAVAEIKATRQTVAIPFDDLLKDSIVNLLNEVRPENDFGTHLHLSAWRNLCEAELLRVKNVCYADEARREDRLIIIYSKIKEIEWHLNECPPVVNTESSWNIGINSQGKTEPQGVIGIQSGALSNVPKQTNIKTKYPPHLFSEFENLRANEVSLIIINDSRIKIIIRKKNIYVVPDDLGLKINTLGWKLLAGAALAEGDLREVLRKINITTDREKAKVNVRKMVSDLNKKLRTSMGLMKNPIIFEKGNSYRFCFKSLSDASLHGNYIPNKIDAMDHADYNEFNDNLHSRSDTSSEDDEYNNSNNNFWQDNDD